MATIQGVCPELSSRSPGLVSNLDRAGGGLLFWIITMCQRATCRQCGKPTWVGCGRHIEQALQGVPVDQRCTCPRPKSLLGRLVESLARTRRRTT
jgi:hypothetical protein